MEEETEYGSGYSQGSEDAANEVLGKIIQRFDHLIGKLELEIRIAQEKIEMLKHERDSVSLQFNPN